MTDVFDEISDDLRREKLNQFWKENGSWIIGGALGAVLLTGVMTAWRTWEYSRDAAADDTACPPDRLRRLVPRRKASPAQERQESRYDGAVHGGGCLSGAASGKRQSPRALQSHRQRRPARSQTWRDLARIHSLSLRLDKDLPEALAKELAGLSGDKDVWRYTAREMEALLEARQGHMQKRRRPCWPAIMADPFAPRRTCSNAPYPLCANSISPMQNPGGKILKQNAVLKRNTIMKNKLSLFIILPALLLLGACSTFDSMFSSGDDKPPLKGERISIPQLQTQLVANPAVQRHPGRPAGHLDQCLLAAGRRVSEPCDGAARAR